MNALIKSSDILENKKDIHYLLKILGNYKAF